MSKQRTGSVISISRDFVDSVWRNEALAARTRVTEQTRTRCPTQRWPFLYRRSAPGLQWRRWMCIAATDSICHCTRRCADKALCRKRCLALALVCVLAAVAKSNFFILFFHCCVDWARGCGKIGRWLKMTEEKLRTMMFFCCCGYRTSRLRSRQWHVDREKRPTNGLIANQINVKTPKHQLKW